MAVAAQIHGFVREIEWTQLWLQGCGRWGKNRHTMTHRLDVDNRWPPPRDYQASGCGRNRRADGPVFDHAVGLVCLVLIFMLARIGPTMRLGTGRLSDFKII